MKIRKSYLEKSNSCVIEPVNKGKSISDFFDWILKSKRALRVSMIMGSIIPIILFGGLAVMSWIYFGSGLATWIFTVLALLSFIPIYKLRLLLKTEMDTNIARMVWDRNDDIYEDTYNKKEVNKHEPIKQDTCTD